jgi:hypothetical protein
MRHRLGIVILVLLIGAVVTAQEHAVMVLKSGERIAGDLVDLGGSGFTIKVNSQSRQVPTRDVAAIEFASGKRTPVPLPGEHVLVLRNGDVVHGELIDIGGTHPLKITFRAVKKDREYPSSEISRIVLGAVKGK